MTDRIPQPTVELAELIIALAALPAGRRRTLAAVFGRFAGDRGWDPEIRGFATVIFGALTDLTEGTELLDVLRHADQLDVTDGSLARYLLDPADG